MTQNLEPTSDDMNRQSELTIILEKPSSFARMIARRIASASAIYGATASSDCSLQATKQFPVWSLITTPIPIRRVEEKIAESTFIKTVPSSGGDHFGAIAMVSRLLFGSILQWSHFF
jgi:hypothetical protein